MKKALKITGLTLGLLLVVLSVYCNGTAGCIALTNEEVDELYEHTPIGTVIEIRP